MRSCFFSLPASFARLFPEAGLRGALLAAAGCLFLAGCASVEKPFPDVHHFNAVVIDAGHGGHDSGALARLGRRSTLAEKALALDVAQRLEQHLSARGLRTVMTRRDDRFIRLDDRVAISNETRNSVFVSIHFNDSRKRYIHGVEVYHNARGTEAMARGILSSLAALPGGKSRGVMVQDFRVLRLSQGPAILVECGFLSNRPEALRCASPAHRERIALAISEAIMAQKR